jgi:hypothetical protein
MFGAFTTGDHPRVAARDEGNLMKLNGEDLLPKLLTGLLGDADKITKKAGNWSSVTRWRFWQNTQAVGVAVGTSIIPVTGVVTTPVSMLFTYRKMAHVAWAIGGDLNAEIEPLDDMLLITGLWTGAVTHGALSTARFLTPVLTTAAVSAGVGYGKIYVDAVKAKIPAEEIAIRKIVTTAVPRIGEMFGRKIGEDAVAQTASRIVPLVGAAASGGLTLASMSGFAKQANVFYSEKRERLGAAR